MSTCCEESIYNTGVRSSFVAHLTKGRVCYNTNTRNIGTRVQYVSLSLSLSLSLSSLLLLPLLLILSLLLHLDRLGLGLLHPPSGVVVQDVLAQIELGHVAAPWPGMSGNEVCQSVRFHVIPTTFVSNTNKFTLSIIQFT